MDENLKMTLLLILGLVLIILGVAYFAFATTFKNSPESFSELVSSYKETLSDAVKSFKWICIRLLWIAPSLVLFFFGMLLIFSLGR